MALGLGVNSARILDNKWFPVGSSHVFGYSMSSAEVIVTRELLEGKIEALRNLMFK